MLISQTEGYFKNPKYRFLEESMLFLLSLKWNLCEKAFSSVKTKTNPHFVVKLSERSNHSFLLSVWWITFFKHLCSLIRHRYSLKWGCRTPGTHQAKSKIRIGDPRYQDPGPRTWDPRPEIQYPRSGTREPRPRTWDPGSGTLDQKIQDPQLRI